MKLSALFGPFGTLRAGVLGDFCLDVYWKADMRESVLSRETPHHPLPVVEERMSPGGAGNAAVCLAALEPSSVCAFGVTGPDWRGAALHGLLRTAGVQVSCLSKTAGVVTAAYIKPLRCGISDLVYEDPRIDFENRTPLPESEEERLLRALEAASRTLDVLLVLDQLQQGCVTPRVRERISALAGEGLRVVVDSRDRIGLFRHAVLKPNHLEAERATGERDALKAALSLSEQSQGPVVVTLGAKGCVIAEKGRILSIPGKRVPPPIDAVGAGDAFMSAFSLALAAGAGLQDAAALGNAASAVIIRKIGTTGTATREEIEALW